MTDEQQQKIAEVEATLDDCWVVPDPGFGFCALCGSPEPGFGPYLVHITRAEWCYCPKHKICWCVGSNILSSWQYQSADVQTKWARMLDGFAVIDAYTGKRAGYVFEAGTAIEWIEEFWNRP